MLVAEHYNGQTPFSSIEVGICRTGPYKSNSSWHAGGTTFNNHEEVPTELYDRLFGDLGQIPDPDYSVLGTSREMSKSMLDVVMEDAKKLQSKVGAKDKARLEQHLEGLREIELRLEDFTAACELPDPPMPADYQDNSSEEQKQQKADLMSDLLAVAMACDLSRVFSYEWSATQSTTHYWEVGIFQEHHEYNHQNPQGQGLADITQFIMAKLRLPRGGAATDARGRGQRARQHDHRRDLRACDLRGAQLLRPPADHVGRRRWGDQRRDALPASRSGQQLRLPEGDADRDPSRRRAARDLRPGVGGPGGVADRVVSDSITELEA